MSDRTFKATSEQLTPEVYRQFKTAVEIGKWPDGRKLTAEQTSLVMEAIILYENAHLPRHEQTGQMQDQCKSKSGSVSKSDSDDDQEQTITLQ